MRFHKKKTVRPYVERKVKNKIETRDAIVWQVDEDESIAWVKIQGYDGLINAHFPQNMSVSPQWCRVGNAVRVRHRGGVRGYFEIIGEGRAIPTAIIGVSHPSPIPLTDGIIEGLEILPTTPASMSVYVTEGYFRIDQTVYYYSGESTGYIIMDDPAPMVMEFASDNIMGIGNYSVSLAPHCGTSGEWRYDLIQIGTDSVLDYITGECGTDPEYPEVEDDHLMVDNYIFVSFDTTAIESWNVGYEMVSQIPTWVDFEVSGIGDAYYYDPYRIFNWCDPVLCNEYPNPEVNFKVLLKDQLGQPFIPVGGI